MSNVDEPSPYQDEPSAIPDEAVLLRRVSPQFIEWDQEDAPRVQSAAFQDYQAERAHDLGYPGPAMSVHLAAVLEEGGLGPTSILEGYDGFGLVGFTAGQIRAHSMGVQRRPTEDDVSHAVVFATNRSKRSGAQQKRVREAAEWVIIPELPDS